MKFLSNALMNSILERLSYRLLFLSFLTFSLNPCNDCAYLPILLWSSSLWSFHTRLVLRNGRGYCLSNPIFVYGSWSANSQIISGKSDICKCMSTPWKLHWPNLLLRVPPLLFLLHYRKSAPNCELFQVLNRNYWFKKYNGKKN